MEQAASSPASERAAPGKHLPADARSLRTLIPRWEKKLPLEKRRVTSPKLPEPSSQSLPSARQLMTISSGAMVLTMLLLLKRPLMLPPPVLPPPPEPPNGPGVPSPLRARALASSRACRPAAASADPV